MKTLLVIHHSMTDGARQMAQAALEGAMGESNIAVGGLHAAEAAPEDLLEADGYIFATPENLASMAGVMKDFFDRCYYPLLDQIQGRPYAMMICAGSDGTGAARQIARIAIGWRLKPIAEPLIIITGAQTPEAIAAPKTISANDLARCEELGAAFAAGLASGIF
jgi:NAD(P)H-dependent FMN reductase